MYAAEAPVCGACAMKHRCTSTTRALDYAPSAGGRITADASAAKAQRMRLGRCRVERPFAGLRHVILIMALASCSADVTEREIEISLATLAYNLKTMIPVLGGNKLAHALVP
jgi:hypothetical protein